MIVPLELVFERKNVPNFDFSRFYAKSETGLTYFRIWPIRSELGLASDLVECVGEAVLRCAPKHGEPRRPGARDFPQCLDGRQCDPPVPSAKSGRKHVS